MLDRNKKFLLEYSSIKTLNYFFLGTRNGQGKQDKTLCYISSVYVYMGQRTSEENSQTIMQILNKFQFSSKPQT